MSKKKKYYDLAEERALTIPVVMWRFCAYKSEKDYESGEHYFVKDFIDHTEMKVFSGKHSAKEKSLYPDYCSMYWKIETMPHNVQALQKAGKLEYVCPMRYR